ncbi:Hypothetical predicted protein [Olea europaea subsp. europaea]|uniref:Uncharacterized protein n=1 Tax=Olea europaea subsp. europaea TaxID=158383 RepID=A0A8S0RU60_OLEEU|nr:Hypothetical predicted protein [Olea europaea subsp. europaea]
MIFLNLTILCNFLLTDTDDDSDFDDSRNDISSGEDNLEFEKNVIERIEVGCAGGATERDEDDNAVMLHDKDHDADDLECPSSEELLSAMSSMMRWVSISRVHDRNGYARSTFSGRAVV